LAVVGVKAVFRPTFVTVEHDRAPDAKPKAVLPIAPAQRAGADATVFAGLIERAFEQRKRDAEFIECL
jgi:hypothetical protein